MKKLALFLALAMSLLTMACKNDEPQPEPEPEPTKAARTVLVYMVADNSLGRPGNAYDQLDIKEMQAAVNDGALGANGRLLVYHCRYGVAQGNYPVLCELRKNQKPDTLKRYPDNVDLYSVDPERMSEVFATVKTLAPADSYGLVLWSHGSGWQNETTGVVTMPRRSYGVEQHGSSPKHYMSVESLGEVLDNHPFDFVYFDVCHMITVEVVYQLRHGAKTIVGSPTELLGPGMDYSINIPMFFAMPDADLVGAAEATFKLYNSQEGAMRTCSMTVVDTSALDELAEASRQIYASYTGIEGKVSDFQTYTRSSTTAAGTIYDYRSIIDRMTGISAEQLADFDGAMKKAVLYAQSTPWIFEGQSNAIRIKTYCGLGSYYISSLQEAERLGYMKLDWWKDVVSYAYSN